MPTRVSYFFALCLPSQTHSKSKKYVLFVIWLKKESLYANACGGSKLLVHTIATESTHRAHVMSESSDLPTSAFDKLLPKLIAILELTQPSQHDLSPQARQALLLAVCAFLDPQDFQKLNFQGTLDQRIQRRSKPCKKTRQCSSRSGTTTTRPGRSH
jgi:hypothetical protein